MWRILSLIILLLCSSEVGSQYDKNWISQGLRWRNIGPANMMGRIAAVKALSTNYRKVLVASASGGVFLSNNAGMTWDIIFDTYGACSIGAIEFFEPEPEIIWVGTGEAANRNSSGWGNGLFKSQDGGKSFEYVGLKETHHIAEIATHPSNKEIVYVAAVGHLWGYSGDRGLFKTTDGGKTWEKLSNGLPNDGKTGCTEIIIHPQNPDILFAGFYHRLRKPYHFESGGANGGIFKSTDGGSTWRKITKGLPAGKTGMIDISIHLADPNIMVAAVEADENLPITSAGSGVYRSEDEGESWAFIYKHHVRPFYHGQIQIDPMDHENIYVVSRDFRISQDGGLTFFPRTWRVDGGDDHDMWIAPYDNHIMYFATDQGLRLTIDGGDTFFSFNNMAIGQYYAIGVDMRDPYWIVGGLQDNGIWATPSNSREVRGILNMHTTWVGEGDGFHCQIDPTDHQNMYIVNHVGFAARVNIETREHQYITPTPETIINFEQYADPDFEESPTKYTIDPGEYWFYYEYLDRPLLPAQFRFNWSSPLVLSPNNPRTIYFGGNHLFKSVDQGASWRIISPDLTTNDPEWRNPSNSGGLTRSVTGGENHFTIITISESPVNEAVIWAGTDDGNVQVTIDGGVNWTNVKSKIPDVPEMAWVSRVEASHFNEGTCFVTFDNHRYDDFKPYVFRTEDFGQNWTNITNNLPDGFSTYVIKEDLVNPDLLFVGTENAVHVSMDGGESWLPLMNNMPTVAVHDLVIHPRDGDLIAGTHGRSIWVLDDISPLREMAEETVEKDIHIFEGRVATQWQKIFTGRKQPYFEFHGENPLQGAYINFYLKKNPIDSVEVVVTSFVGDQVARFWTPAKKGLNRAYWDFLFPPSEKDRLTIHQQLGGVISVLENKVKNVALKEKLIEIKGAWQNSKTDKSLNDIRKRLVDDFAVYAPGHPFFGKKLMPKTAEAGIYKVSIQAGTLKETGVIRVRKDPLLEK